MVRILHVVANVHSLFMTCNSGFTSAFAKEVAQFGIRVVTVHPHITKSNFGVNIIPGSRQFPTEIYEDLNAEFLKGFDPALSAAVEPDVVAKACLEAATDTDMNRLRYFADVKSEERASELLKEPRKQLPTHY